MSENTIDPEIGADRKRYPLTPKQAAYAALVAKGDMTQSDCYRAVYNPPNAKNKTIHEDASRLANSPKIAARIKEHKQSVAEQVGVDIGYIVDNLQKAIKMSIEQDSATALTQATKELARILALDAPQRTEATITQSPRELPTLEELLARHNAGDEQ